MNPFMHTVANCPLWISVSLILSFSLVLALVGVTLVRRRWPHPAFKENNEFVGATYSVFGLVYGVLLAFVIVVSWTSFSDTEQVIINEATCLSELWRDAQGFSQPERDMIHDDLITYVESIIVDEWPSMAHRGEPNVKTQEAYEEIWRNFYEFKPANKVEEIYLGEALTRMNELSKNRRERIMLSSSELYPLLWLVLIVGALPTGLYTLFFAAKHVGIQYLVTFFMIGLISLSLLLVLTLQYPFTGDNSTEPAAFGTLLASFHQRQAEQFAPQ